MAGLSSCARCSRASRIPPFLKHPLIPEHVTQLSCNATAETTLSQIPVIIFVPVQFLSCPPRIITKLALNITTLIGMTYHNFGRIIKMKSQQQKVF